MNIPAFSSLQDLLDDKKFDSRRQDDEPINIQEIIRKFIERKSNERKQAKAKWLPLYEIILSELQEYNYGYTLQELQDEIDCMLIGSKIALRFANNGVLRAEIFAYRTYILEKINKISKITIQKIIFC